MLFALSTNFICVFMEANKRIENVLYYYFPNKSKHISNEYSFQQKYKAASIIFLMAAI